MLECLEGGEAKLSSSGFREACTFEVVAALTLMEGYGRDIRTLPQVVDM